MKKTFVGCSLNAEIFGVYTDNPAHEKLSLETHGLSLNGSSATVSRVLNLAGCSTTAFGLVGPSSLATDYLHLAATRSNLLVHHLEVLDETSFAFLPIDRSKPKSKIAGQKGNLVPDKIEPALRDLRRLLNGHSDVYGVMTGLREVELPFAREVFRNTPKGKRVASPRREFCLHPSFFGLLSEVDCLVVNEIEFVETGRRIEELYGLGPRVIVVTQGKKGGYCLIDSEPIVTYDPFILTEQESPGTGDWFLGAVMAHVNYHNLSFLTVTAQEIAKSLKFAATVAGHKAVFAGAANGPSEEFVRELLASSK